MKIKTAILSAFLVLMLLITACSGSEPAPVEEEVVDLSSALVKEGVLTVASDVPYGKMEFFDENGEIVGFEIDIAREIANRLGLEIEVIDYEWDDIFVDVKSGAVDIAITSMTITEERSQEMLFSKPYFNAGQTMVVRSDSSIASTADLSGVKVAAQVETTSLDEAKKLTSEELVVEYVGLDEANEAGKTIVEQLKESEIDAILVDFIAAVDLVAQNPELKVGSEPFTQEYYGIPTQLGNEDLMNAINGALDDMKSEGFIKGLEAKWFK